MFTTTQNTRKAISAVAAVTIVAFSGLVMDRAHLASAPAGTVEIGELQPLADAGMTITALPEVIVVAKREPVSNARFAAVTQLPEIVVVAKRVARRIANTEPNSPAMKAEAEGALLK